MSPLTTAPETLGTDAPQTRPKDFPLVSAGLPVYNGERFIVRALDSLCAQDYPNLEIIVSDNASTDRTAEIGRHYAGRDKRVRFFRQAENRGVQKNFEAVLAQARGSYFFWAGVDDLWMPSFTRVLVEELERHAEANLAMTAFDRVYEDGGRYDIQRFLGRDSPNGASHLSMLLKTTSPLKFNLFLYGLFRTTFIRRAVCYFPDIPYWDRVFMCMLCLATPIRYVDSVLHRHTLNPRPLKERYPEEKVFRGKDGAAAPVLFFRTVRSICRTTLRSDLVPAHRKWYLAPGVCHYGMEFARHESRRFLKSAVRKLEGRPGCGGICRAARWLGRLLRHKKARQVEG